MLEVWGGPECTVNRIGDRFCDQTVRTGHHDRPQDLERFASLGLRRLRYPVLWERISPDAPDVRDFAWTDARLSRIRELGLGVIAGLVHHGSGPRRTNLLDDTGFAQGLAEHARAVAQRYPWIDAYTPVNEPLTTARFSALYGHWHPHATDEGAMWRALLNQVDATRLAMRAVREVNPQAQLVATDDLGHTHAAPAMAERAAFDNARRWMGWDLMFGRVTRGHPLHARLAGLGLADRLAAIADDPCPPDVVGVNHYVTSERFLDDEVEAYPPHLHPRPGEPRHVDVEASRVSEAGVLGIEALLAAAWDRYRTPLAVTECHNGASRADQLRWVVETWEACQRLRAEGADVRAVTAWSLLGAVDWNSLLTREDGWYEPGVFDVSGGGEPRETALAPLWRALARGEPPPVTLADAAPGWWRREARFMGARRVSRLAPSPTPRRDPPAAGRPVPPLLIVGASEPAAGALADWCAHHALPHRLTDDAGEATRAAAARTVSAAADLRSRSRSADDALARACRAAAIPYAAFAPVPATLDPAIAQAVVDRLMDCETGVWRIGSDSDAVFTPGAPTRMRAA